MRSPLSLFRRLLRRLTVWLPLLLVLVLVPGAPGLGAERFVRGDTDVSGELDITDGVRVFGYLFLGLPGELPCRDAADSNDDGEVNLSDGIRILGFLFSGGEDFPAPFPGCGTDPTADGLDCASFELCPGTPAPPILEPPVSPTAARELEITGSTDPGLLVRVLVDGSVFEGRADASGRFSVPVTLTENRVNRIWVLAVLELDGGGGAESAPAGVSVLRNER